MITIEILNISKSKDSYRISNRNKIFKLSLTGHALLAKKGEDVLCAAISALSQTLVLSITKVLHIKQDVSQESGDLRTEIDSNALSEKELNDLILLVSSFIAGVIEIQKQYPDKLTLNLIT